MPITALPTPPSRQDPANFASRADDFLGALPDFATEANALEANVNAKESSAVSAAAVATAVSALTSFRGSWASLTGAYTVPSTVYHAGYYWQLLANTADITAIQPGVSASWAAVQTYVRDNLVPGVEHWSGGGLSMVEDSIWGPRKQLSGAPIALNTYVEDSPWMECTAGESYTITGDSLLSTTGTAQVYFDLLFYQSDKTTQVTDGGNAPITTSHDFIESGANRVSHQVTTVAGVGAAFMKARFVGVLSAGSTTAIGFRRVKVERGALPATTYTEEATLHRKGLTLLDVATAASSTSVDFTRGINSTFQEYLVEFINVVPATNGVLLNMRTSSNAGSSYDAGASDYEWAHQYSTSAAGPSVVATSGAGAVAQISISGNGLSNAAADGGISGFLRLMNPAGTTHGKHVLVQALVGNPTLIVQSSGAGIRRSTSAVNAIRFLMSSGNIASGLFKLYGVKK